jgi:hypothetical protein
MISNLYRGHFAGKLQILRNTGNYCSRKYAAVVADTCAIEYDSMREYMAVVAYYYVFFYYDKRVDSYILPDLRFGVNNG